MAAKVSESKSKVDGKPLETKEKKKTQPRVTSNEMKWGKDVLARKWTIVPNLLIENLAALGVRTSQLAVLLVLIKYWWEKDRHPFPAMSTVADQLGIRRAAVQRTINILVKKEIISKKRRKSNQNGNISNEYNLGPLVAKLKVLAEKTSAHEIIQVRERKRFRSRTAAEANQ